LNQVCTHIESTAVQLYYINSKEKITPL